MHTACLLSGRVGVCVVVRMGIMGIVVPPVIVPVVVVAIVVAVVVFGVPVSSACGVLVLVAVVVMLVMVVMLVVVVLVMVVMFVVVVFVMIIVFVGLLVFVVVMFVVVIVLVVVIVFVVVMVIMLVIIMLIMVVMLVVLMLIMVFMLIVLMLIMVVMLVVLMLIMVVMLVVLMLIMVVMLVVIMLIMIVMIVLIMLVMVFVFETVMILMVMVIRIIVSFPVILIVMMPIVVPQMIVSVSVILRRMPHTRRAVITDLLMHSIWNLAAMLSSEKAGQREHAEQEEDKAYGADNERVARFGRHFPPVLVALVGRQRVLRVAAHHARGPVLHLRPERVHRGKLTPSAALNRSSLTSRADGRARARCAWTRGDPRRQRGRAERKDLGFGQSRKRWTSSKALAVHQGETPRGFTRRLKRREWGSGRGLGANEGFDRDDRKLYG